MSTRRVDTEMSLSVTPNRDSHDYGKVHDSSPPKTPEEPAMTPDKSMFNSSKAPTLLYFEEKELYDPFYSFLIERSSQSSVAILSLAITTVFTAYLIRHFTSHSVSKGGVLMLLGRVLRCATCVFNWLYLYFIRVKSKKAVSCGDLLQLFSSIAGAILLLARSMHGACREGEAEDICNPHHANNGMPTDTLVANLFLIVFLPVIFKAHRTSCYVLSYIIMFTGLLVSMVVADVASDILLIIGGMVALGIMIYDHKRNMMTMFLLLQEQQSYYDQLLAVERNRASAVMEKEELRNLIGNVAHDLKTPLQALMVEVDGLQAEVDAVRQLCRATGSQVAHNASSVLRHTAEAQKYIESLREIYQFAMLAINRALDFRKVAAGLFLMPITETFHLPRALDWAVQRFSENPSGVSVRLKSSLNHPDFCPYLSTDKHWMTENILTLLSNACKFTSRGEIVMRADVVRAAPPTGSSGRSVLPSASTCDVETPRSPSVMLENAANLFERASLEGITEEPPGSSFIRIVVEDTGIGVAPEAIRDLFRAGGQNRRFAGGTGLGLFSLAKRMEVLNGQCGMYARTDGQSGCCFWFAFPYMPDRSAWTNCDGSLTWKNSHRHLSSVRLSDSISKDMSSEKSVSRAGSPLVVEAKASGRVLVVDDSSLILKTTSRMLRKEGFEVETAQNGEEALGLMELNSYYFVLSDIQMPVMDGLEMTRRIRQVEAVNALDCSPQFIIGMSANSDVATRDESLACGMDVFVPKPVRFMELAKWMPTVAPVLTV